MGNQKISIRLTFLIVIQLIFLIMVGFIAYLGMDRVQTAVVQVSEVATTQANLSELTEAVRNDLLGLVSRIAQGSITWEEAEAALPQAKSKIELRWQQYIEDLGPAGKQRLEEQGAARKGDIDAVQGVIKELQGLFGERDRPRLNLFVANDLQELINPFFKSILESTTENSERSAQALANAGQISNGFRILITIVALFGLVVTSLMGSSIYRAIVNPVNRMVTTVQEVNEGNFAARTGLRGGDELGELGGAFDNLLNERVGVLVAAEQENERLNNSIIALLQAVAQLSQRDLTVRVPVTEDVTGSVADALNLLTDETAKVLTGVTRISEDVAAASDKVKSQSDAVIVVADNERQQVEQTATELAAAADAMNHIAELAQVCNTAADNAIQATQQALNTVTSTVTGINSTRDTIRETEKRIKRLGERSQEISSVVNIINAIAERTHILALNASMHAASAGEAGRGFAVVADEVQRLAENSREATSQIATLVSNIQTETTDTVNAMNTAISQVVEGSHLAEQAGEQMRKTRESTGDLAAAVQQIATRSLEQAHLNNRLVERAKQIQESTQQTSQQLQEQTVQTTHLVEYARNLVNSVRVFRLPA